MCTRWRSSRTRGPSGLRLFVSCLSPIALLLRISKGSFSRALSLPSSRWLSLQDLGTLAVPARLSDFFRPSSPVTVACARNSCVRYCSVCSSCGFGIFLFGDMAADFWTTMPVVALLIGRMLRPPFCLALYALCMSDWARFRRGGIKPALFGDLVVHWIALLIGGMLPPFVHELFMRP